MTAEGEETSFQSEEKCTDPPSFRATRNYQDEEEKSAWWYIARWSKDHKYYNNDRYYISEEFRTRRRRYVWKKKRALRLRFENCNEIGAFIKLTNSYCLIGKEESENFLKTMKGDLPEIPIIATSIAGCRIVGRLCIGNKNGLLLPETVYDTEFEQIKKELPDSVQVKKVEERLSALGNVIVCNDNVAIIHPELNKESEEIIADTLQVEVFRHVIANNPLVGSYCVLNNNGGLVCPGISNSDLENISSLLQIPLTTGTVNGGSKIIAGGLAVNDMIAYAGMKTTSNEFSVLESIFQLDGIELVLLLTRTKNNKIGSALVAGTGNKSFTKRLPAADNQSFIERLPAVLVLPVLTTIPTFLLFSIVL